MGREPLPTHFPIAAETFEEADEALGFPLSKLIFEGPEEDLRLTENTQPAILTVSVAAWRVLGFAWRVPGAGGGSLAGRVVCACGRWNAEFSRCGARGESPRTRDAVGGSTRARRHGGGADAGCRQRWPRPAVRLRPRQAKPGGAANFNSPSQTVISGALAAVEKAAELAKAKGARRAVMFRSARRSIAA
jgi:[acyl-carrier-protein] S-malonyltransferase